MSVVSKGNRRFRKQLLNEARSGNRKTRIVGQRGSYAVAVRHGEDFVVVSPTHAFKSGAANWGRRKTLQVPSTRTLAATLRKAA